jgi:hypothetical protein
MQFVQYYNGKLAIHTAGSNFFWRYIINVIKLIEIDNREKEKAIMSKKNMKEKEVKVFVPEEAVVASEVEVEAPIDLDGISEELEILETVATMDDNEQLDVMEGTQEITEVADQNVVAGSEVIADEADVENEEPVKEDADADTEEVITNTELTIEVTENSNESLTDNMESEEPTQVVTPVAFRSDSEMAKHFVMELVADKESHKKQEIVAFITQKACKNFSDAIVINVLRNMTASGNLIQLERGSYKIGSGIGLVSKLISFIDATLKGLEKITTVSVSDITDDDLSAIHDVKLLRGMLEDMYERLGSK